MADPVQNNDSWHPTLLSSCARATTRDEATYRVAYPNSLPRATRIVALDDEAAAIMRRVSEAPWQGAHFLTFRRAETQPGLDSLPTDAVVAGPDGTETKLSAELDGADVVVMIATEGSGEDVASLVGTAGHARNIMVAGLVVTKPGGGVGAAVKTLRPLASVLVIASGEEYVPEMLTALRA